VPAILEGQEKLVAESIVQAVVKGAAVMLSPTRDGGALGVHVWHGFRTWKDYVTSPEELEEVLAGLAALAPAGAEKAAWEPLATRFRAR